MIEKDFPVDIQLPQGSPELLADATIAVREEYRKSVRRKKLRARQVCPVEGESDLFRIEVGHALDLDWTWEGAVAFRPPGETES